MAFHPVTGAFEAEDAGVVHDAVDHRGGDGLVAEDLGPNERLLVRISDACSHRLATSWKNRFAAS